MFFLHSRLLLTVVLVLVTGWGIQADTYIGKRAEEWARLLDNREISFRRSAVIALGQIGAESERYLPRLLKQLGSEGQNPLRAETAMAVAEIVKALGDNAAAVWPTCGPILMERLKQEKDPRVRRGLLLALGAFGSAASPALAQIQDTLKDDSPMVRQNAAFALGHLKEEASAETVHLLIALLNDKSSLVRRDAAGALGGIGLPAAQEAFVPLLELAEREAKPDSGDSSVLKTALENMARLSVPHRIEEASRLHLFLDSQDAEIARATASALARMRPARDLEEDNQPDFAVLRPAVPILRTALREEEDHEIQEKAAACLGLLGPTAVDAVSDLALVLNSPEPLVRNSAALALGHIGPLAKPAIPSLLKALANPKENAVSKALFVEAISFIRYPANAEAIPTIVEILQTEKDVELRRACVNTFSWFDNLKIANADKALNSLLDETGDAGLILRYNAASILANNLLEKAPDKVIPILLEMLKSDKVQLDTGTKTRVDQIGTESSYNQASIVSGVMGDGRFIAAKSLGMLGKKANKPEVIKALEEASKDRDEKLKKNAILALKRIRG